MVRAMPRCARTCTVYVISVTHKLCVHENQTYSVASRLFLDSARSQIFTNFMSLVTLTLLLDYALRKR